MRYGYFSPWCPKASLLAAEGRPRRSIDPFKKLRNDHFSQNIIRGDTMRFVTLAFLFQLAILNAAHAQPNCLELEQKLKNGDLVFLGIDNFFFKNVAKATNTWVNHVGIAFQKEGEWVVAESRLPVSTIGDFCSYISRAGTGEVAILRLKHNWTNSELEDLWLAAEKRKGILYHQGFDLDSSRQFCSKYVYEIFDEVLGIQIGKVQTFKEILDENTEGSLKFWNIWFFGDIPWDRRTITPKSQLDDSKLETVWSWTH